MKSVWHSELFSDCCPTFGVQSVHRSHEASREIQRESSVSGTANKVKVRPRNDHNIIEKKMVQIKNSTLSATLAMSFARSSRCRTEHGATCSPRLLVFHGVKLEGSVLFMLCNKALAGGKHPHEGGPFDSTLLGGQSDFSVGAESRGWAPSSRRRKWRNEKAFKIKRLRRGDLQRGQSVRLRSHGSQITHEADLWCSRRASVTSSFTKWGKKTFKPKIPTGDILCRQQISGLKELQCKAQPVGVKVKVCKIVA